MIRYLLVAGGLIFSLNTFAAESDVSIFGGADTMHSSYKQLQECIKNGWEAASPTDVQTGEVKVLIQNVKTVLERQRVVLKKDKQDLLKAWGDFPISSQAVEAAEMALHNDIMPVYKSLREAKIRALNLLTADQKNIFNSTFASCHKNVGGEQAEEVESQE